MGGEMEVVGYLNHADLLLEDENGVAVVTAGHYVLSLGDRVVFKQLDQHQQHCQAEILFASAGFSSIHKDEFLIRFAGSRENLNNYLQQTTVH